jgi:hypothetical protein
MSSENIIIALIVAIAVIGAIAGESIDAQYVALALVGLGLVTGFMSPSSDMGERTGMLLIAVALPAVANQLDAIPAVGMYLNSILDSIAVGVAGMYLANFTIALYGRIKPA